MRAGGSTVWGLGISGRTGGRWQRSRSGNIVAALVAAGVAIFSMMPAAFAAAAPQELIINGDIETGTGTTADGWTVAAAGAFIAGRFDAASSGAAFCCGQNGLGFSVPVSGTFSLMFTQTAPSEGFAFQTVTIPAGARATLKLKIRALVQGTDNANDFVRLDIVEPGTENDPNSSLLSVFNLVNTSGFQDGDPAVNANPTVDLSAFAGRQISLRVYAEALTYPANIAIDDVSIAVTFDEEEEVAQLDTRKKTAETIQRFLRRRTDMLLSNGPNMDRQISRFSGSQNGASTGGSQFADANTPGGRAAPAGFAGQGRSPSGGFAPRNQFSALGGPKSVGFGAAYTSDASRSATLSGDGDPSRPSVPVAFQSSELTEKSGRVSFATSLTDMAKSAAEAKRRQLAGGNANLSALGLDGVALVEPNSYALDVWVQGTFTYYDQGPSGSRSDGDFGMLYVGMDYMLSPAILVGALFQYDRMDEFSADLGTRTEGQGWMVGPYVTVKASDNVFIQGRAAWGKSDNEISPFLTYEDSFDTERWLIEGSIQGRWAYGPWSLNPRASVAYVEEDQESYTDSLGFVIASNNVSLGQARFGPQIGYVFTASDGTVFEPFVGLEGIWNFDESGSTLVASTLAGAEEFRGRVSVGFQALSVGGMQVHVVGSYDGIGADDFDAYTSEARLTWPLN